MTGVTGYIGGSVAANLVSAGYSIRGLVRDEEKNEVLRELGIEPVLGSLDDFELLKSEAARADGVINTASSDHRAAVEALIEGLEGSGKPLLHTSGISLVGAPLWGELGCGHAFSDRDILVIGPDKAARYSIDMLVCTTAGIRGVVLCNALIYGDGPVMQPHSVQVPPLVQFAREAGSVCVVGRGLNRWSTVHIDDVVALYRLALERSEAKGFYFVESGDASFVEIRDAIAARLKLPCGPGLSEAEAIERWGVNRAKYSLAGQSLVKAERAKNDLAWRPAHHSVLEWIRNEMPV
nr:NAD-dependent epimerase/dehydratase family protein [uncultured Cupriavidus sp.]